YHRLQTLNDGKPAWFPEIVRIVIFINAPVVILLFVVHCRSCDLGGAGICSSSVCRSRPRYDPRTPPASSAFPRVVALNYYKNTGRGVIPSVTFSKNTTECKTCRKNSYLL